jgi:hypothetical protein
MKVDMNTVSVGDEFRRRLRMYRGEPGLATEGDVREWRAKYGESFDEEMYDETEYQWNQEKGSASSTQTKEGDE